MAEDRISTLSAVEVDAAQLIVQREEYILLALLTAGQKLVKECHRLIDLKDKKNVRKPPAVLVVRQAKSYWGPKLVWIRFSAKRTLLRNGRKVRFTEEIPGRKNGRYPQSIFRGYELELRRDLIVIEARCVDLRHRVTFWRDTIKRSKKLLSAALEQ